jgi:hypothetical protein
MFSSWVIRSNVRFIDRTVQSLINIPSICAKDLPFLCLKKIVSAPKSASFDLSMSRTWCSKNTQDWLCSSSRFRSLVEVACILCLNYPIHQSFLLTHTAIFRFIEWLMQFFVSILELCDWPRLIRSIFFAIIQFEQIIFCIIRPCYWWHHWGVHFIGKSTLSYFSIPQIFCWNLQLPAAAFAILSSICRCQQCGFRTVLTWPLIIHQTFVPMPLRIIWTVF